MSDIRKTRVDDWAARSRREKETWDVDKWIAQDTGTLTQKITVDAISRHCRLHGTEKIFDVGFGWGRVLTGLKREFPNLHIDGVDLIDEFVQKTRNLVDALDLGNIHLEVGDIQEYKGKPGHYDAIYSTRVLHYIEDKRAVLREFHRMLRPGGRFINLIPNRWCPARWFSYPHPLYSIRKFKRDMESVGFEGVQIGSVNFVPPAIGRRLSYSSQLFPVERMLQIIPPMRWLGGLALVVGQKR